MEQMGRLGELGGHAAGAGCMLVLGGLRGKGEREVEQVEDVD